MDNNMLGYILTNFIQAMYPGGKTSFVNDGGLISLVPFKEDTALIFVPNIIKEFEKAIEQFNDQSLIKLLYTNDLNFEGKNPESIIPLLIETCKEIYEKYHISILLNPTNPLVLFITIPLAVSSDIINDIIAIFISRVPGIVRGILITVNNIYPFSIDRCIKELKTTTEITNILKAEMSRMKTKIPKSIESKDSKTESIPDESIKGLKKLLEKNMDVIEFLTIIEKE